MSTGSGLDAQLGYRLETTVGTEATVNKFLEFNSESLSFDPRRIEPAGLRTGSKFKNKNRLVSGGKMISGSIEMDYAARNMGALWKAAIGSGSGATPVIIGAGPAYKQVHQTGDIAGTSLTLQVGRPEPISPFTVKPHTIRGCKITGWEFSVSDNDVVKWSMEVDGWDESTATALAAASYVGGGIMDFTQCTAFTLGGTVSGTTEMSVAGGTSPSGVIKSLSIKGDNQLDTERFGLGNAGVKKEQLEAGTPTITVTFDAEYVQADYYTLFKGTTSTAFYCKFEGPIISGTDKYTTEFVIPALEIKKANPVVAGPGIVRVSVEAEVYTDTTNNPFQVKYISPDTAL